MLLTSVMNNKERDLTVDVCALLLELFFSYFDLSPRAETSIITRRSFALSRHIPRHQRLQFHSLFAIQTYKLLLSVENVQLRKKIIVMNRLRIHTSPNKSNNRRTLCWNIATWAKNKRVSRPCNRCWGERAREHQA